MGSHRQGSYQQQTLSSVWLTTSSAASTPSSSPTSLSSAGMRAVLLLVCCLISVYCELEVGKNQALGEASANGNLGRNLREAGRRQNENKKGKARKTKKNKKSNEKKKAKKQKDRMKKRNQKDRKRKNNKHQNKSKKQKKGKKKRKQIKRKGRKSGKKKNRKMGTRRNTGSQRATATCNGTALDSSCLTNLISALKYERDAVANFMNQKARAEDFKKLIGNKGGKNDTFGSSTTYLLTALGGNVSNLSCGSQNSSGDGAITTYKVLKNCSTAVSAACMVPNTTVNFTKLDECKTYYDNVQKTNAKCFKMTMKGNANSTEVCECWKAAADAVVTAKSKKSDCSANTAQSDMKDLKNTCLASFSACKKAEDASVSFILQCATDSTSNTTSSTNSTRTARAKKLF